MIYIYAGYVIKMLIVVFCFWLCTFLWSNYHVALGAVRIEQGWCYGYKRDALDGTVTTYCDVLIPAKYKQSNDEVTK